MKDQPYISGKQNDGQEFTAEGSRATIRHRVSFRQFMNRLVPEQGRTSRGARTDGLRGDFMLLGNGGIW